MITRNLRFRSILLLQSIGAIYWSCIAQQITVHMHQSDIINPSPSKNLFGAVFQHFRYGNGFWDQHEQIIGNGMETDINYDNGSEDGLADCWYLHDPQSVSSKSVRADFFGEHGHYQVLTCASTQPIRLACNSYYQNIEETGDRFKNTAHLQGQMTYRFSVSCEPAHGASGSIKICLYTPSLFHIVSLDAFAIQPGWNEYYWEYRPSADITNGQFVIEISGSSGDEFHLDEAELISSEYQGVHGFYDEDMLEQYDLFGTAGIPILRFPGGTSSQSYIWTDGIGNALSRPLGYARLNSVYPDAMHSVWVYEAVPGVDEFLSFCENRSIEPLLVVNQLLMAYGDLLSAPILPGEAVNLAADWVEYCNSPSDGGLTNPRGGIDWAEVRAMNGHTSPYNVKYWEVGNEEWCYPDANCPFNMCAEIYAQNFTTIARAMKSVDSDILIAATGHVIPSWNDTVLAIAADQRLFAWGGPYLMDHLTVHLYNPNEDPGPSPGIDYYMALVTTALQVENKLADMQVQINGYANENLSIAITEHSSKIWQGDNISVCSTLGASLYTAGVCLGIIRGQDSYGTGEGRLFSTDLATYHSLMGFPSGSDEEKSPLIVSDRLETRGIPYFIGSLLAEPFQRTQDPVLETMDCEIEGFGYYNTLAFPELGLPQSFTNVPYLDAVVVRANANRTNLFILNRNLSAGYDNVLIQPDFGPLGSPSGVSFDSWRISSDQQPYYQDINLPNENIVIESHQSGQMRQAWFTIDIPPCSFLSVDIKYLTLFDLEIFASDPTKTDVTFGYEPWHNCLQMSFNGVTQIPYQIELYDLLGRRTNSTILRSQDFHSHQSTLKIPCPSSISSGTYVIRLVYEDRPDRFEKLPIIK